MSDPDALITRIHDHIDSGDVDAAVYACLRLARSIGDYFNAVTFLREMRSDHEQFKRQYVWNQTGEIWIEEHTVDIVLLSEQPEKNVIALGVGEMRRDLDQIDKKITDLTVPAGLAPYDASAFHDRYSEQKAMLRLRAMGINQVLERIRNRCADYASRVEAQRRTTKKTIDFLASVQNNVNNYFAVHHEETFRKLQKANELVDSEKPEDSALLLTSVRRAMRSIADHFFPPSDKPHTCSDGKIRVLGEEQYLNRLEEFCNTFPSSSSSNLLKAELAHLGFFARRLNGIASKGVHAEVNSSEARQGLLGLYLFTSNLISRLEQMQPVSNAACATKENGPNT